MKRPRPDVRELAGRVRQGDETAAAVLRIELEQRLTGLVRYILRTGAGSSLLTESVRQEIERMIGSKAVPAADHAHLAQQIAQRMALSVIDHLRAGGLDIRIRDTVLL